MKFSDKLQKVRKKNNITQEGLADRLNVSRQAVSKWESGQAYPDTEKLIQISKIFNVSLDELINENVDMDRNVKNANKKLSFMEIFNSSLDFISKSVNMFWSMKFSEKIKCLFEISILILIIFIVGLLSTSIIVDLVRRIFMFLPADFLYHLCSLFETLLILVWLVLGTIIVIKIFKSRYLDYYVFVTDSSVSEKTIEEPIKELKEKKEYKVVIRDPEDSSLNMFKKLGGVCFFFIKILCFIIMIPVVLFFIFFVIVLIYSLFYLFDGLFFNGISIAIFGLLLFIYLVIEFIYDLLFNREHAVNRIFVMFIGCIIMMGVGLGFSFRALSEFSYEDSVVSKTNTYVIDMSDDLILDFDMYEIDDVIIDNELDKIKIEINSYNNYGVYLYNYNGYNNDVGYRIYDISYEIDELKFYQDIINNLKEKKIVNYNNEVYDVKIYISNENLVKLRNNISYFYSDLE